jgi:hypothetical protein
MNPSRLYRPLKKSSRDRFVTGHDFSRAEAIYFSSLVGFSRRQKAGGKTFSAASSAGGTKPARQSFSSVFKLRFRQS